MPDMAPAPGSAQQQQPPMGVSPATGPTPNRGYEAAGMQKLGIALKVLTESIALLGANSEAGQDVLKMVQKLAKLVPSGSVSPAAERNGLEGMMLKNQQSNQQMQALRQRAMQGQPSQGQQPAQQMPGQQAMAA